MYTRPLIRKDIPQIATIAYDAYSEDALYNWLYPGLKQYPEDHRRSRVSSLHARLARPGCHGFVAVDEEEEQVIGYVFFLRTTKPGAEDDEGAKKWMQDTWFNKLERTLRFLTNTYNSLLPHHNRAISPKNLPTYLAARSHNIALYAPLAPYWHVSGLAISPKFQRRGVGALLMREGQRLAREDLGSRGGGGGVGKGGKGVPMVLESSPAARRLYERCGFEVFWEGKIGGLEDVCMVWYPEGCVEVGEGKGRGMERTVV